MQRRAFAVATPKGAFSVKRKRADGSFSVYWYFQKRRGRTDAGPRHPLPGDPTRREFWEAYDAIMAAEQPIDPTGTMKALLAAYKAHKDYLDLAASSRAAYDIYLAVIEKAWGGLRVDGLTPLAIREFLDGYQDRPVAGNLCLSILTTVLAFGAERGYSRANPAREVSKFDIDGDGAHPWPEEVYAAISERAPEIWRRAAVLGRGTGQRGSDLIKMRPADWDGEGINHTITKLGGEGHWSPVDQPYAAIIRGWDCGDMTPYLSRANGQMHTAKSLQNGWGQFQRTKLGKELGADKVTLHGLRATAVCDDRVKQRNHQVIAARRGMSVQMVERYSRFVDKRLIAEQDQKGVVQMIGRNLQIKGEKP